ncbi:MAG: CvpA family protein [Pirellulales bacterium]|nr:CvpA family protein [Pirellulales bacterium]
MNDFDFAILVLVAVAGLWGAYRGFVRQVTALVAWSIGIVAAAMFRAPVAELIGGTAPANEIGAAIVLLFVSSLVVHMFGSQVRGWIEDLELDGFDRQMGFALGGVKGVSLAALVTIAAYHLHEPSRAEISQSLTARHVAGVVEHVEPLVLPPADAWIAEYAKEPFEEIRDGEPTHQPRRLFVASRPTAGRHN